VFSFSATLYKLSGAPPAVGSALRFGYATLFLALLAWQAGALRPGPGFAPAASAGVLVGLEVVIWNEATRRIGAGPSTVIVNTASLWVMALTVVVLRRPVGLRHWATVRKLSPVEVDETRVPINSAISW